MMSIRCVHIKVGVAAAAATTIAQISSAQPLEWVAPADGAWNIAGNWASANIPDKTNEAANLGHLGPYTVTFGPSFTTSISGLSISNPNATLAIGPQANLRLNTAGLVNDGLIRLLSSPAVTPSALSFLQSTSLSGIGTIRLEHAGGAQLVLASGRTLSHGANHTIVGTGVIQANLGFTNHGVIRADVAGQTLNVTATNNGLIEAVSGGIILPTRIVQTPSGTIRANNGEVRLLTGMSISGGVLESINGGTIVLPQKQEMALNDVTLHGELQMLGENQLGYSYLYVDAGGLTNNGLIRVHKTPHNYGSQVRFRQSGTLDGTGTIRLESPATGQVVSANAEVVLTHGAGHTICGTGFVQGDPFVAGAILNYGTIRADDPTGKLRVNATINYGLVEAINGGILEFEGGGTLASTGLFRAGPGGTFRLGSRPVRLSENAKIQADGGLVDLGWQSFLIGGSLEAINGGQLVVIPSGEARFDGVILHSDLLMDGTGSADATELFIRSGGLVNNATIRLTGASQGRDVRILFDEVAVLSGPGTVRLESAEHAKIYSSTNASGTNAPGHTIAGTGVIQQSFVNKGDIIADQPGMPLTLRVLNESSIRAINGAQIRPTFVDQTPTGVIDVDASSILLGTGHGIRGGKVNLTNGSVGYVHGNASLTNVTISGEWQVGDPTAAFGLLTLSAPGVLENNGLVRVLPGTIPGVTRIAPGTTGTPLRLAGTGSVQMESLSNASLAGVIDNSEGHTVRGEGSISGTFTNYGTLSPGLPIGTMLVHGITLKSTSVLEMELAGASPSEHDKLDTDVTAIYLGGTLRVRFLDGYVPSTCDEFVLISSGQINGTFSNLDLPAMLVGKLRVIYEPNAVRLTYSPADHDGSGFVDCDDYTSFVSDFELGTDEADFDNSGFVDTDDFTAFVHAFEAGC